uniref:Protein EXORDIUM n=1 Tax=Anthurium amnicola TaxID=1678845 RepID=A0A1D1XTD3_9ARAE
MSFPKKPVPFIVLLAATVLVIAAQHGHGHGALVDHTPKHPSALVPSATTQLQYHKGPLLTEPINVYLTWYGAFSPTHKAAVSDFFASFSAPTAPGKPTVSTWWRTAGGYKDAAGKPVSFAVKLSGQQVSDPGCSLGKSLKRADVVTLVRNAVAKRLLPSDAGGVYLVLTASDVAVERFCMGSCGFHGFAPVFPGRAAVVAHVGDAATQCPGLCAWPFAVPAYGPPGPALVAPNGVGVDGVVMNVATVLAGAATNPMGNGYYQGDALAPLEAVTACPGVFGPGAYPGYPGQLLVDPSSKASFNAYGARGRRFLLPAMWDPPSLTCRASA